MPLEQHKELLTLSEMQTVIKYNLTILMNIMQERIVYFYYIYKCLVRGFLFSCSAAAALTSSMQELRNSLAQPIAQLDGLA